MIKLTPALIALSAIFSSPAFAAEWFYVDYTTDGNAYLIDRGSLRTNGNVKTFWVSAVFSAPKDGVDLFKIHHSINCRDMAIGPDFWAAYTKDGRLVDSGRASLVYEPIIPDSLSEGFANIVCLGRFRGQPVSKIDVDHERSFVKKLLSNKKP